jgi:hypothetical protein
MCPEKAIGSRTSDLEGIIIICPVWPIPVSNKLTSTLNLKSLSSLPFDVSDCMWIVQHPSLSIELCLPQSPPHQFLPTCFFPNPLFLSWLWCSFWALFLVVSCRIYEGTIFLQNTNNHLLYYTMLWCRMWIITHTVLEQFMKVICILLALYVITESHSYCMHKSFRMFLPAYIYVYSYHYLEGSCWRLSQCDV